MTLSVCRLCGEDKLVFGGKNLLMNVTKMNEHSNVTFVPALVTTMLSFNA